jgi:hypothetical protein
MNFLPEKKCGVPSRNSVKKNVLCEIGDEITRFDGTLSVLKHQMYPHAHASLVTLFERSSGIFVLNSKY